MASLWYQYETSPRKIEPEYEPVKRKNKNKKIKKTKLKKIEPSIDGFKKAKQLSMILIIFFVLLAISYRNSLINERFKEIKGLKNELSTVKKENGQINKSIEESLNKENMEKIAVEQLGMQRKTKDQTVEIIIEKSDYIETSTDNINNNEEENWFEKILNNIF